MNTADTILNYIRTQLTVVNNSAIGLDCNLPQEGHLDSTAMLDLILWVGETFNLSIQNEDLTPENFATPRNIVEFVHRLRNEEVAGVPQNASVNIASY
jgi:acyl carrier protein